MATTYTSTIEVRCWKQHTCVGCGGNYRYQLVRSVKGSAGSAEGARAAAQKQVQKTLATDTDLQPCPTCGLHQPDMVAQRRAKRHWIMFWCMLAAAALVLILVAAHVIQFYVGTYFAAFLCVVAAALSLSAELWNPNRDLAQNRQRAGDLVSRGVIQQQQPVPAPPPQGVEQHARPAAAPLSIAALVVLGLAFIAALVPDVARLAQGWPANEDAYPPVVGPGDEARVYMKQSISSIKGYWRGQPQVVLKDGDRKITAKATTNDNNWGGTIYAKSSEKSTSSTPWVAVTIPNDKKLAGKKLGCDIELAVEYPASMGSSSFQTTSTKMHRSVRLDLAPAGAGGSYEGLWWGGTGAALVVVLIAGLMLVGATRALRARAPATQVSPIDA
jgi:hypothetical protein